MRLFIENFITFGAGVLSITIGIMVLTLFFHVLSWLFDRPKSEPITFKDVLRQEARLTVHMAGGSTYECVRFVGVPNNETTRTFLPSELHGMIILDEEKGGRLLVRAEHVQLIEIAPDGNLV